MVYYSERYRLNSAKGRDGWDRVWEGFLLRASHCLLPRVTDGTIFPGNHIQYIQRIVIQGISTNSWYPDFLFGFSLIDLADHPPRLTSVTSHQILPEVTVTTFVDQMPQVNKDALMKPGFSGAQSLPPRSQGQGQVLFLDKVKFFIIYMKMGLDPFREI